MRGLFLLRSSRRDLTPRRRAARCVGRRGDLLQWREATLCSNTSAGGRKNLQKLMGAAFSSFFFLRESVVFRPVEVPGKFEKLFGESNWSVNQIG